jgi:exonuclease SbcC
MIPICLTLESFLSYREKTRIDFSRLNVACISGPNGAGKSSIFDAITWVLFGKARRNDDDTLISSGADSCRVELELDYENNRYRIERGRERGKNTKLELQVQTDEGQWKPMTESGLRATEARIRQILHLDYDTFINTSFFLQGKADLFAQQSSAKRKEILCSILGLEIWEAYREETFRRRRGQEIELYSRQNFLNEILVELEHEQDLTEKKRLLENNLEKTSELRQTKENAFNQVQVIYQQLKADEEKLELQSSRLAANEKRFETLEAQLSDRRNQVSDNEQILKNADEIGKAYQTWQALRAELEKSNALADQFHSMQASRSKVEAQIQTEEARLRQELSHLQEALLEVQKIQSSLPPLEADVESDKSKLSELEEHLRDLPTLDESLSSLQSLNSKLRAENLHLKDNMDELKTNIEVLEAASGTQCPLCGQPLSESHRNAILEQLNREGKCLGDQYRENNRLLKENEDQQADLQDKLKNLRQSQSELAALQRRFGQNDQRLADYREKLDKWQSRDEPRLIELKDLLEKEAFSAPVRVQLQQADASIQKLGYQPEEHEHFRQKEREARAVEDVFHNLEKARTTVESLHREIDTLLETRAVLEKEITDGKTLQSGLIASIQDRRTGLPDITQSAEDLNNLRQEENSLRQQVGAARQMMDVLEKQRQRQVELTLQIADIKHQVANLKTLELAFGKDGIQALLIEQALPEIEFQANDILDRLSNGRMSVAFMTEREYKNKKREDKKQTLDILISDASGQREYELFSGGEAFRINFAIRLALSRVLAQRAGARLRTLVIDEGFGSQDAEGRQRLIEAINIVSQDFAKILVITHLEELKDAFSSRIEVQKTQKGSMVEVIP